MNNQNPQAMQGLDDLGDSNGDFYGESLRVQTTIKRQICLAFNEVDLLYSAAAIGMTGELEQFLGIECKRFQWQGTLFDWHF